MFAIPLTVARSVPFFQQHYWGPSTDAPDWRRIDADWLDGAAELALALDSATNNTSLVLAIELAGGDVLLFVADAQVGNWESWQALSWNVDGHSVTGPDLLKRTVFYKVTSWQPQCHAQAKRAGDDEQSQDRRHSCQP